jgi:hypothetical protein
VSVGESELEFVGSVMPNVLNKPSDTKQDDRLEDIWKGLSPEQRKKLLEKVR